MGWAPWCHVPRKPGCCYGCTGQAIVTLQIILSTEFDILIMIYYVYMQLSSHSIWILNLKAGFLPGGPLGQNPPGSGRRWIHIVALASFFHRFRPGPVWGGQRVGRPISDLRPIWICFVHLSRNDPDVFCIDRRIWKPKMKVQKPKNRVRLGPLWLCQVLLALGVLTISAWDAFNSLGTFPPLPMTLMT